MKNDRTVLVSYGLRESAGERRIVHLETERKRNVSEDYVTYSLSFFTDGPMFKVPTADDAMRTLLLCPEWFNTSQQMPAWGRVDPDTLEVVRIEEVLEVESVGLPRPLVFDEVVSTTRSAHSQCEKLLGRALPPHYSWAVRVVQVPAGESLETLRQKCEGTSVFVGALPRRTKLHCHFVLPEASDQVMLVTTLTKGQR